MKKKSKNKTKKSKILATAKLELRPETALMICLKLVWEHKMTPEEAINHFVFGDD